MMTPDRQGGTRIAHPKFGWASAWLLCAVVVAPGQPLPTLSVPPPANMPFTGSASSDFQNLVNLQGEAERSDDPTGIRLPDIGNGNGEKAKGEDATDENKQDEPNGTTASRVPQSGVPLGLGECLAIARERAPTVKAARHSLDAARLGQSSLNSLGRLSERLSPDLPIRRQQATQGIAVAEAELEKVCQELTYDVTLLYWGYVYARQQEKTASDVIDYLEVFYKSLEEILKAGVPDPRVKLNQFTLYSLRDSIGAVKLLRVKAVTGQKKALAALREAMGVDPGFDFHPRDTELPVMAGTVRQDQVINWAVTRRPELAQAAAGMDAFRLEVCAQGRVRLRRTVPTLASGSDLHSRQVPMPVRNGEYRPGALAPEMPPMLVGKTEDRVARAAALSQRQEAVFEKTLNLVRLEAENTFIYWESSTERMKETNSNYENAKTMLEQARSAAAARPDPDLVIRSEAMAAKAQGEYLEAVFEHIKALATLERVTAGAIRPDFPGR